MNAQPQMSIVYRSLETGAAEDCETIRDLLADQGIAAEILDDTAPEVPEGAYEVRVAAADCERAEQIIDANPLADDAEEVDDSDELDLETIYHSEGSSMAEVEAMGIKNVLEANGIATVVLGDSMLPNLAFEVRVARDQVENARKILAEATASGSAAAEEAELAGERAAEASGQTLNS